MAKSPPPATSADDAIGDLLEALWHRLEEALDRSIAADADLGRVASLCREAACLADAAVILAGRPSEPAN